MSDRLRVAALITNGTTTPDAPVSGGLSKNQIFQKYVHFSTATSYKPRGVIHDSCATIGESPANKLGSSKS